MKTLDQRVQGNPSPNLVLLNLDPPKSAPPSGHNLVDGPALHWTSRMTARQRSGRPQGLSSLWSPRTPTHSYENHPA